MEPPRPGRLVSGMHPMSSSQSPLSPFPCTAKTAPAPLHPRALPRPLRGQALLLSPTVRGAAGLYRSCQRETGRARPKKKTPGCALVQWPSALKGAADGLLRFGLAFGHALGPSAIPSTAVPYWRMVRSCQDARTHLNCFAFPVSRYGARGFPSSVFHWFRPLPRVRLRYARCPARSWKLQLGYAETLINHQTSGSENQHSVYPRLPQAGEFTKGRTFPSLTAARDRQPPP